MPVLTADAWLRLRAEWEVGLTSTRALAARHGVSEKAIRKRAVDERNPWRRDAEAKCRARAAAHEATLQGLARSRSAREVRANPQIASMFRDAAVSDAADAIVAANLRHLEMAAELRATFSALWRSLMHALARDAGGPGYGGLVGRGGIAHSLLALARLGLAIQQIERTALGMRDGVGVTQPPSDPAGRTESALPFRIEDLSTEELSALVRLAELADQASNTRSGTAAFGSDGLPVPPACPG